MMVNKKLSLSELQFLIRDVLYTSLPDSYWVVAEISEIKENYAGHAYLELVEKQDNDVNITARARGIIWNKQFRFLKPLFENATGESLREGLKVLVRVKVEYHETYGLSLIINDIDPAFTLGEMALRRQQILRRLEEEGVLSMNKELEFPIVPQRIAVISSSQAAGYSDFIKQLSGNPGGFAFMYSLFEAVMQGNETERSIIHALDSISERTDLYDVVVIIRGGGSQSDLSWFDNYNIAYHVTQFPLPIITGIGHEKDLSVTDIVAYRTEKTPTAVADFLINCMSSAENSLIQIGLSISGLVADILEVYRERITAASMKIIPLARMKLSIEKENLSSMMLELINVGKEFILREEYESGASLSKLVSAAVNFIRIKDSSVVALLNDIHLNSYRMIRETRQKMDTMTGSLKILNPENVLKRGYTITSREGMIITGIENIRAGDIIDTRFSDGSAESEVKRTKSK